MRQLLRRLHYWLRHRDRSQELAEEIECHRVLKQKDLEQAGLSSADAEVASRRVMGNALLAMEDSRRVWMGLWLEQATQDLTYAVRTLARRPGFGLAAGLTIALGVGANTAVFSVVEAVLLQQLPVQHPNELVFLDPAGTPGPSAAPPYPCLTRLPSDAGSFVSIAVFASDESRIEIQGRPEQVMWQAASGNYFELLGVKPALGRLMRADDENLSPAVAVISDRYWRRRFGGDPAAVGKTISAGNRTFTIAGVTAPDFSGVVPGIAPEVTVPITTSRNLSGSGVWWFDAIARLKPGVSENQAQAEASAVFQSCMSNVRDAAGPGGELSHRLRLHAAAYGEDRLRNRFSKPLYLLMGIVGLLLLMATANIASLLLARGVARRREFAIRMASGAGRARLVRQLFTETLVLFAFGAVPGVLFASWGVHLIESFFAQGRRPIILDASFNWRVLAFSMIVTLVTGLIAGLFPALRAFRTDPDQAMRDGHVRTSESRASATLSRALVAFQVALSLVLLVGAVTFVRTLANLHNVDAGFENAHVLTMSIEQPEGPVDPVRSVDMWSRVLEAVRGLPAVRVAGLSTFTPLSGRDPGATRVRVAGFDPAAGDASVRVNQVSEGYFETLEIPLLRGRFLTDRDANGAVKVALINESAAKYFGPRDLIGQVLEFDGKGTADGVYQIVGVVGDTKHRTLREPSPPFIFLPTRQPMNVERRVTLVVASTEPQGYGTLVEPIRRTITGVDPRLFISDVLSMQDQRDSTLLTERLLSGLATAFGALALILAAVGLYGVLSYRVGQQRRSIGIQMALGAASSSVAFSVLRQSALVVGVGLLAGLPFAFLAARAADSMLWGLKSTDPWIYVSAVALLSLTGVVSSYLPARRAAAIEPTEALRHD